MKKLLLLLIISLLFFNSCRNKKKEHKVLIKNLVQKDIQNEEFFYYENKLYSGCAYEFHPNSLEFWKTKNNKEFAYLLEDSMFLSFANIPYYSPGITNEDAPDIPFSPPENFSPIIANIKNTDLDRKKAQDYIESKYADGTFDSDLLFYFTNNPSSLYKKENENGVAKSVPVGSYKKYVQLIALVKSVEYGLGGPVLVGKHIDDAEYILNLHGDYSIFMKLNEDGSLLFSHITQDELGNAIAIVLDQVVYTFPIIQGVIVNGSVEISGNFTVQQAQNIASIISNTLPKKRICYEDGRKTTYKCWTSKGDEIPDCEFLDSRLK
tara:strand:- start:155 stop:1120 length:966 start_codon:yes stop_codon:yes gene_type:complete